jgi:phosphohistidine phosphatase
MITFKKTSLAMKRLYLLRHFHAQKELGETDFEQKLSAIGKKQGEELSEYLRENSIIFQKALFSTSIRTIETKNYVCDTVQCYNVEATQKLYYCTPDDLLDIIEVIDDNINSLLIVGHNPYITDVCSYLRLENSHPQLKNYELNGKLLCLELDDHWHNIRSSKLRIIDLFAPQTQA